MVKLEHDNYKLRLKIKNVFGKISYELVESRKIITEKS